MVRAVIFAAAAFGNALPAHAETPRPSVREVAIPFVSRDGIIEWKADGDRALFIHANNGRWYHVSTQGRCSRLRTAVTLGFETSALDQLDRHGAIHAEGWRCPIDRIVETSRPPRKKHG